MVFEIRERDGQGHGEIDSYDVRFWDIKKTGSGSTARYGVWWAVSGRERCKSFKAAR